MHVNKIYVCFFIVLSSYAAVHASDTDLLVSGASISYFAGKNISAPAMGYDITYGHFFDKEFKGMWLSTGGSYYPSFNDHKNTVYFEAGIWYLFNAGIGYTCLGADEFRTVHIFLGAPLPPFRNSTILFEPYVRQHFSRNHVTEIGVLLKYIIDFR
jgi:hypothetical protein